MVIVAMITRPTTRAPWILSVRKEIWKPPRAMKRVISYVFFQNNEWIAHTGVDSSNNTFHDDHREAIETSQGSYDLTNSGQLCNHVQEQGDESQETQEQSRNDSITLSRPLSKDEAFGALSADDRSQEGEHEEWQGRREGVYQDTLDARNSGEFRIREQNTRAET